MKFKVSVGILILLNLVGVLFFIMTRPKSSQVPGHDVEQVRQKFVKWGAFTPDEADSVFAIQARLLNTGQVKVQDTDYLLTLIENADTLNKSVDVKDARKGLCMTLLITTLKIMPASKSQLARTSTELTKMLRRGESSPDVLLLLATMCAAETNAKQCTPYVLPLLEHHNEKVRRVAQMYLHKMA